MNASDLLASLDPNQLAALKAAVAGLTDTSGRSPFRPRQLHDLTLPPTADDPRPTFFWSAVKPRNVGDLSKTTPFPRLLWHVKTGKEITVGQADASAKANEAAMAAAAAEGYTLTAPPSYAEKPPMENVRDLLDGLSAADRDLVLKGAHATKLQRIQDALLGLSDAEREELAAVLEPAKARKAS